MARLLVVDDDEGVRQSLCDLLSFGGHQVEWAEDGQEALDRLHEGPAVDLMLLDMYMPHLDGVGVLDALVDGPSVVVLSAFEYVSQAEIEARYAEKVCAFLVKPVLPPVLVRTVEGCLKGS